MSFFRAGSSLGWCLVGILSLTCTMSRAAEHPSAATGGNAHPLEQTIQFAASHSAYFRENIRDYSCRLVKRERIKGKLQARQFAEMNVRCAPQRTGGNDRSLSVFMQFLSPSSIKDRRVLYVADQYDGKVLVRKGGKLAKNIRIKVDPLGARARSESKKPITDIGFDKLLDNLARQAQLDMQLDPTAANTRVSFVPNQNVNNRACTQIRIEHPNRHERMAFHVASLYMDDELHMPVRYVIYGWPQRAGDEPPVNEEYNYIDLRLNVGLSDADFSETLLEGPYRPLTASATNVSRQ